MIKVALPYIDDGHYKNYIIALEKAGMEPVPVALEEDIPLLDMLLLPGGWDIDPARYGEENAGSLGIMAELDSLQFAALDLYVKAGKPVLGVQWHPERMFENGGRRIFDFFRELAEGKRTW